MERIKIGDLVQHFKRETLSPEDRAKNFYVDKILGFATHSETKEKLVVYQALYNDPEKNINFGTFVRPYDMFMSEVDREKYPDIKQKFRFEVI